MCTKCDGFTERINFATPRDYLDIVRQLIEVVDQGTFRLVHADCPLEDLLKRHWGGDGVAHDFKCTTCNREFHLFADTYHGSASWESD